VDVTGKGVFPPSPAIVPKLTVRPDLDGGAGGRATKVVTRHLHTSDGIIFVGSVEAVVAAGTLIPEPWVGILGQLPTTTAAAWAHNLRTCLGLWVRSEGLRRQLREHAAGVPVGLLPRWGAGFVEALCRSAIYWSLPVPPSRREAFRSYDLTIVICSHARVGDLPGLLSRLAAQNYDGCFEVVVWNNNPTSGARVERLCSSFVDRLALRVIHSSENYYGLARLAVSTLMRSDLLLVCDDDVLPEPGFVSRFMSSFERYGPDTALCTRGHVFLPHRLDEERPDRVWAEHRHLRFFEQRDEDRPVHFLHANTCLLPKSLITRAMSYPMPHHEFALVDDYWLSFVLGHHLHVPVWKIKADDVLSFTPSSEDPSVALHRHPTVAHERVRFYIHHMRVGWPDFTRPGPHRDG